MEMKTEMEMQIAHIVDQFLLMSWALISLLHAMVCETSGHQSFWLLSCQPQSGASGPQRSV